MKLALAWTVILSPLFIVFGVILYSAIRESNPYQLLFLIGMPAFFSSYVWAVGVAEQRARK